MARGWKWRSQAAMLGLCLLLQACANSAPEGQVIAVVNGEEVTLSELNEEARARGVTIGDDSTHRQSLVAELIDRKLLAQRAIGERLDQTPEHVLARRRADELTLVQQLVSNATQSGAAPSAAQVRAAIAANPQAFARRALLTVERLSFASLGPAQAAGLGGMSSADALAAALTRRGIPFARSLETWDSANLDAGLAARLQAADGQMVLIDQAGTTSAVAVLSVAPRPVPPEQMQAVATQWLARRSAEARSRQLLQDARRTAEIRYQRDFAPQR
jgi:EpsD family peptidyl-prolyl cis-trans isomerase